MWANHTKSKFAGKGRPFGGGNSSGLKHAAIYGDAEPTSRVARVVNMLVAKEPSILDKAEAIFEEVNPWTLPDRNMNEGKQEDLDPYGPERGVKMTKIVKNFQDGPERAKIIKTFHKNEIKPHHNPPHGNKTEQHPEDDEEKELKSSRKVGEQAIQEQRVVIDLMGDAEDDFGDVRPIQELWASVGEDDDDDPPRPFQKDDDTGPSKAESLAAFDALDDINSEGDDDAVDDSDSGSGAEDGWSKEQASVWEEYKKENGVLPERVDSDADSDEWSEDEIFRRSEIEEQDKENEKIKDAAREAADRLLSKNKPPPRKRGLTDSDKKEIREEGEEAAKRQRALQSDLVFRTEEEQRKFLLAEQTRFAKFRTVEEVMNDRTSRKTPKRKTPQRAKSTSKKQKINKTPFIDHTSPKAPSPKPTATKAKTKGNALLNRLASFNHSPDRPPNPDGRRSRSAKRRIPTPPMETRHQKASRDRENRRRAALGITQVLHFN